MRQSSRATPRASATNTIAEPQKSSSFGTVGCANTGEPGQREEDPGADGEHVEEAEQVVDRRVIGACLVAVVEPVDPREQRARAAG